MWTCYRVYLEAKAPIYIGYGVKLGIVDRTRYYIPAKNVWGALTNLIVKSVIKSYDPKIYQEIGRKLNEGINFSYFYPIKYEKGNGKIKVLQVFAPYYTEEGLKFGICKGEEKISLENFERTFISSFVSTALDKISKSAEEGSLHEIEFIRDKISQDKEIKATMFVGYFFVKDISMKFEIGGDEVEVRFTRDSIAVNEVKLNEMWIGGERNYGFGRMKIFLLELEKENRNLFNTNIKINVENEQLIINSKNNSIVALSHINIENMRARLIRGDIEPLIGREWDEKGSGQKIRQTANICIVPGSQLVYKGKIIIGDFGVWEVIK